MSSVSHRKYQPIVNTDVDALEEIGQIDCSDIEILWIGVNNALGSGALTDFDIECRTSGSMAWVKMLDASANYTTPVYPLIKASTDPTLLAADATALLCLNVRGLERIKVSAAGANSAVTLYPRGA